MASPGLGSLPHSYTHHFLVSAEVSLPCVASPWPLDVNHTSSPLLPKGLFLPTIHHNLQPYNYWVIIYWISLPNQGICSIRPGAVFLSFTTESSVPSAQSTCMEYSNKYVILWLNNAVDSVIKLAALLFIVVRCSCGKPIKVIHLSNLALCFFIFIEHICDAHPQGWKLSLIC